MLDQTALFLEWNLLGYFVFICLESCKPHFPVLLELHTSFVSLLVLCLLAFPFTFIFFFFLLCLQMLYDCLHLPLSYL